MVKGGASSSKNEGDEQKAVARESARLRNVAVSRGILRRSLANPAQLSKPSKVLLKCDGKDIVKKGSRKSKFLFSFPGLIAPVAGGKFGDLAYLDTRNPVLYIELSEGRLKLFGTIVYPKNKYLTLQMTKGSKNVVCDDFFEAIVVFSETWWIGKLEDNPEELKLEMPKTFQQEEKHTNYDFVAGAGCVSGVTRLPQKAESGPSLTQSTLMGFQSPSVPDEPLRCSARLSHRKRSYEEFDISDDENTRSSPVHDDESSPDPDGKGRPAKKSRTSTMLDFLVQKASVDKPAPEKKQATIDSLLKKK